MWERDRPGPSITSASSPRRSQALDSSSRTVRTEVLLPCRCLTQYILLSHAGWLPSTAAKISPSSANGEGVVGACPAARRARTREMTDRVQGGFGPAGRASFSVSAKREVSPRSKEHPERGGEASKVRKMCLSSLLQLHKRCPESPSRGLGRGRFKAVPRLRMGRTMEFRIRG